MKSYRSEILVRFSHCDAAGIVFYPRYIEMFNNVMEEWCRDGGIPFAEIHNGQGLGIPTVHMEVDFLAPSVRGDVLSVELNVISLGVSSLTVRIAMRGADGGDRVKAVLVVVLVDVATRRPVPFSDEVRAKLT